MKSLINAIKDYCVKNNESISVAENITSGCLQMLFGNSEDAALYFNGGITTISGDQLSNQLGVMPVSDNNKTDLNLSLTIQMAKAVAKKFGSEIGIAINGYNGNKKSLTEQPSFAAIVRFNQVIYAEKLLPSAQSPSAIPIEYAQRIINRLAEQLMPVHTDSDYYRIPA